MTTHRKDTETQPILELISRLLDDRHYSEALAQIIEVRRSEIGRLASRDIACLFYYWSRCLHESGSYAASIVKAKVAQYICRELADHKLYADIKIGFGKSLFQLGRLDQALEEFNEAYVTYKRAGENASLLLPLNRIANVHYLRGDFRRCSEVLHDCVDCAKRYHTADRVAVDTRNLIRVLIFTGQFPSAKSELASIKDLATDPADRPYAHHLSGCIQLLVADYSQASKDLMSALSGFRTLSMTRDEVVCLEYLGLNEYFAGNYDKAKQYYDDILGREEITASARAQTLRMLTDVYVAKGQWQQAAETAELADAAITKINERIELGALDRARGQIAAHASDNAAARQYFEKSIRLLQEIGARYELALSFLTCGRSEVYDQDERRYSLRRARDLFDEMEVPKRVAEVEEDLARLGSRQERVPDGATNLRRAGVSDSCQGYPTRKGGFSSRQERVPDGAGRRGNDGGEDIVPALLPVVVGESEPMRKIMEMVSSLASTDLTILLTGETGTGKDLLAQYIHHRSGRPGEFVSVNSAAIPNEIVESELFGHSRGAFTGADREKPGLFELAHEGTFYLNEISSCTPEFQAKLLEVLETGSIRRLGETRKRQVDFRLIAASNHDLDQLIREERFRADLFYRLREWKITLPPLHERREDIPALVEYFLHDAGCPQDGEEMKRFCAELGEIMLSRPWPGNVRMLRAEVRRLWFACGGDRGLLLKMATERDVQSKREELLFALRQSDWNKSAAARRLGISEGTVRNRIRQFRLRTEG